MILTVEDKDMKKKVLSVFLSAIIILSLSIGIVASTETFNTSDALIVLRASAGLVTLTDEQTEKYGISGGNVTAGDALRILRLAAGITPNRPPVTTTSANTTRPAPANNPPLTEAFVTRVIDGDTIVLSSGERVRLIGIDAPEIGEPGADEATNFVREAVEGKTVWLESSGADTDRFGRLRRYVWLQQPTDTECEIQQQRYQLNAILVANGLARVFIVNQPTTTTTRPTITTTPLITTTPRPTTTPPITTTRTPIITTTTPSVTGSYIGNINSQIFHFPTCGTLPMPSNRIYFSTRQEAINAGYRACRNCRP
jgi:micrococcal nuclease